MIGVIHGTRTRNSLVKMGFARSTRDEMEKPRDVFKYYEFVIENKGGIYEN
jgi:hypothetical protein